MHDSELKVCTQAKLKIGINCVGTAAPAVGWRATTQPLSDKRFCLRDTIQAEFLHYTYDRAHSTRNNSPSP